MLVISRRKDEAITIEPVNGLDPRMTLEEAFANGPIEIRLINLSSSKARLAIDAPRELRIRRGVRHRPDYDACDEPISAVATSVILNRT